MWPPIRRKVNMELRNTVCCTTLAFAFAFATGLFLFLPTGTPSTAYADQGLTTTAVDLQTQASKASTTEINLAVQKTKTLKVKNASGKSSITWKSSKPKVVTVSNKGVIRGVRLGTATVTAKQANGITTKWTVRVNKTEIFAKEGKSFKTTSYVSYVKGYRNGAWSSNKPKVANVVNGRIVANAPGKARLTLKANGNSYEIKCTVSCNHTYAYSEAYKRTCERKARYYQDEADRYERLADRSWGYSWRQNTEKKITCLGKANRWLRLSEEPYVCTKCGKAKYE